MILVLNLLKLIKTQKNLHKLFRLFLLIHIMINHLFTFNCKNK
jgi:hypothetical protein